MKTKPYFLTYLSALIVGVLLLVFTGKADIFRWMVIIIGILFLLPSLWVIISGATGSKKNGVRTEYATDATGGNNDARRSHNVFLTVIGVCGLVFGVILLSMSGFFAQYIRRSTYTLRSGPDSVYGRRVSIGRGEPMVLSYALAHSDCRNSSDIPRSRRGRQYNNVACRRLSCGIRCQRHGTDGRQPQAEENRHVVRRPTYSEAVL